MSTSPSSSGNQQAPKDQDNLIRQVTQRVWEMLREDLRRESERHGKQVKRGR